MAVSGNLTSPAFDSHKWERALASVNPAMLLLSIERRIGPALAAKVAAEDVLQETLLAAWESRATFEGENPRAFRGWLMQIAEHRICALADHHAAQKRGGGVAPLPFTESRAAGAAPHSATPSRVAWYREKASALRAALESLPDELREIVRLRMVEQMTAEEVAAQLGVGESMVRHRFRRGAELLRMRIAGQLGSRSRGL